MTNQPAPPRGWQRLMQRVPASRLGAWIFSYSLHHIDRVLMSLSNGRLSIPSVLTGLPVVMLTTIGARTGRPRTVPLVGIRDGDKVVVIGTNFGGSRQPAWYHNLRANPEAKVSLAGNTGTYTAREATPAERDTYWRKGDEIYIGYSAYDKRIRTRSIPIMVLTPKTSRRSG